MAMTVAASSSVAVMIPRVPAVSARCSAVPYLPPRSFGRSSFTVPVKLLSGDPFIFPNLSFRVLWYLEMPKKSCVLSQIAWKSNIPDRNWDSAMRRFGIVVKIQKLSSIDQV